MSTAQTLRAEDGQIVSRFLMKVVLYVAIFGFIALEVGGVLFNRYQATDIADQAAAEAGISFVASNQSIGEAEKRAKEYVAENRVKLVDVRVDTIQGRIYVTVERKASTRVVQRIESLKDWTVVQATGSAPLRR